MLAGDSIETQRGAWTFGGNVADTFVTHAERSIPLYHQGHALICRLSDFFMLPGSVGYELGTSTGQLIKHLAEHNAHKEGVRWIGVDRERGMLDKAREHTRGIDNIEFVCEELATVNLDKSSMIASYYTMQFVPPRLRQDVFNKIYESLEWGGALVMFEKVRGPDARFQDILSALYNDFKVDNNFNADEIINKSASLRGVMEPFSTQGNIELLNRAGFKDIVTVFKYICFEGFIAIK